MTTITIQISDEQAERLTQEAERLQMSLQDLAAQRLLDPPPAPPPAPSFEEAMEYVFRKNAELYRRLA